MMKKFLSLLSVNTTMLSFIPFTVGCQTENDINVQLDLSKIFDSKLTEVKIGVEQFILDLVEGTSSATNPNAENDFNNSKNAHNYFKNLQFIALSVLNKKENTCFLSTDFINVELYRDVDKQQPIKDNDELKWNDIGLNKSIYVAFSTIIQVNKTEASKAATKNNNFVNLLQLEFVEYDKGLLNMKKELQKHPFCQSKSNEL